MDVILACVDFTTVTERVLHHAAQLAQGLALPLVILHVAPAEPEWVGYGPGPQTVRDSVAGDLRRAHRDTQALAERLRARGLTEVKALTVQGPAPETILEQADALGARIVVLGAHHRGTIAGLVVGSVARQVLRRATRPVLIIPEKRGA